MRGGEQVEGDAQALPGIQGLFRIQRFHRGGPVPAQSHLPFPHPSAHRQLGSARCPTSRDQLDLPLRESSCQIDELRVVRPFVCVNCRHVYILFIYDRACVRVRIYMYMRMHLYPREFAFVYTHKCKRSFLRAFACVRLLACLRTELIKTQNAFARKIFQHANTLWFRNFQDVLYILTTQSLEYTHHTESLHILEICKASVSRFTPLQYTTYVYDILQNKNNVQLQAILYCTTSLSRLHLHIVH